MPSYLSILLAVGALSSFAAADNIYTYTQSGCKGAAFFFKDIDHNVCALSITGNSTSTKDAIARGLTSVRSGMLEVQETGKKRFIGWDEGPDSNADGLLQCGNIMVNKPVTKRETCIEPTKGGGLHGLSWTEPGDNRKRESVYTCHGSIDPDAVYIDGNHYKTKGISGTDSAKLRELALKNGKVTEDLKKYQFDPYA
ncbi:hypothetical protein J1614_007190 [Plenodomus biglobosus]|nr:hypothetical protein J1614_007190 [Plenodomus biglobosus]